MSGSSGTWSIPKRRECLWVSSWPGKASTLQQAQRPRASTPNPFRGVIVRRVSLQAYTHSTYSLSATIISRSEFRLLLSSLTRECDDRWPKREGCFRCTVRPLPKARQVRGVRVQSKTLVGADRGLISRQCSIAPNFSRHNSHIRQQVSPY